MNRVWSVEVKANSWNDDLFTGSYAECVKYCEELGYIIDGENARLAEIAVDESGCVIDTYKIVNKL